MIAQLRGILVQKSADRVIVDVQGVGYEVSIPFSTYYDLGNPGEEVFLRIYTHVREDALALFGFRTAKEKQLFLLLIQVSGIGPRLAITILSGLPVDDFLAAVSARDLARLSTIPGVGKKTAERIVVELKDRIGGLVDEVLAAAAPLAGGGLGKDVTSALVNLGYQRGKAETAVSRLLRSEKIEEFDVLLRRSLKEMAS